MDTLTKVYHELRKYGSDQAQSRSEALKVIGSLTPAQQKLALDVIRAHNGDKIHIKTDKLLDLMRALKNPRAIPEITEKVEQLLRAISLELPTTEDVFAILQEVTDKPMNFAQELEKRGFLPRITGFDFCQNLEDIIFDGVAFVGCSFEDITLQNVIFEGCIFSKEANFTRTIFDNVLFKDCTISYSHFDGNTFIDTEFNNVFFAFSKILNATVDSIFISDSSQSQCEFPDEFLGIQKSTKYDTLSA